VFRLLKLGFAVAAFAAIAWFGTTVKLGDRTLFQHLRAIGDSKESHDLVAGTKKAAGPLVDDVRRRITGEPAAIADAPPASASPIDAGPPQERISASERHGLDRLVRRVDR
jgi:hypothetical protein